MSGLRRLVSPDDEPSQPNNGLHPTDAGAKVRVGG